MKQDKSLIIRKINFYRIFAGNNLAGEPIEYDVRNVLEYIDKLSFETDARYLKDEDGYDICCWVDELSTPQKVSFGKIKREDLPQIEHKGDLRDLTIPDEFGLAECVHVMFFPNNIVGMEYNYDGPRITRISDYLHAKSRAICPKLPIFQQLLQKDVVKKLENMRTVSKFRLKVRKSLFTSIKQADEGLAGTLQAARELGQPQEIELILSVGRTKGTLGLRVLNIAKRLLTLRDTTADLISGEIRGRNQKGDLEIIDLLSAKIVAEKRIPRKKTGNNALWKELVYKAIEIHITNWKISSLVL